MSNYLNFILYLLIVNLIIVISCGKSSGVEQQEITSDTVSESSVEEPSKAPPQRNSNSTKLDTLHTDSLLYNDALSIEERSTQLELLFEEIKNDELDSLDHSKIYRLYRTFPDNFEDFNFIFSVKEGEDPNYTGMVYSEKYLPRIKFFFKLSRIIPKENYFDKLIKLGINGFWDDGAPYDLQKKLYFIITNNGNGDSSLFISRLMNFSKEEQKSVWYFYFDGPHPPKEIPEYLAFIQEANPEMYTLIEETLKQVQNDWKDH